MKHASIISFLKGEHSPEGFGEEIAQEVAACVQGSGQGGVGYIIVSEGPLTNITRQHAARVLQALLDERLSFNAANYLADGLIMSDDFDFADAEVTTAISFVADESRAPTADETRCALARLV